MSAVTLVFRTRQGLQAELALELRDVLGLTHEDTKQAQQVT